MVDGRRRAVVIGVNACPSEPTIADLRYAERTPVRLAFRRLGIPS